MLIFIFRPLRMGRASPCAGCNRLTALYRYYSTGYDAVTVWIINGGISGRESMDVVDAF